MVADIGKKKIRNAFRKKFAERRKILRSGILKACDEVCGRKRGRRSNDTWWRNEEVK